MQVGGYTLHVYCDNAEAHTQAQRMIDVADINKRLCFRQVKGAGWKVSKKKDLCPECSSAKEPK